MSELTEKLRTEFRDEETRHIYADDFLNSHIATQLKVLREDRGWTQAQLAERAGMRQERISVLEDVDYDAWSAKPLKRLAKAFDLRLSIKFESFGSFLTDFEQFNREALRRPSFGDDPAFSDEAVQAAAAALAAAPDDFHLIFSALFHLPTPHQNVVQIKDFKQAQQGEGNQPSINEAQLKRIASGR